MPGRSTELRGKTFCFSPFATECSQLTYCLCTIEPSLRAENKKKAVNAFYVDLAKIIARWAINSHYLQPLNRTH
jgi:hypothetical protein